MKGSYVRFVVVFVALFCIGTVYAEGLKDFSVSTEVSVLNKYVGLTGSKFEPDEVIQPSLTLSHASGFYANVWDSTGIDGYEGNEIDYFVGWAGDVLGFNADLSVGYYDLASMFCGRSGNYFVLAGRIGKTLDVGGFALAEPFVRIEEDIAEKETDCDGGILYTGGVKIEKSLEPFNLWVEPRITYTPGVFETEETTTFQCEAGIDWDCYGWLTLTPKAMISIPSDNVERENEFVYGLTASRDF